MEQGVSDLHISVNKRRRAVTNDGFVVTQSECCYIFHGRLGKTGALESQLTACGMYLSVISLCVVRFSLLL